MELSALNDILKDEPNYRRKQVGHLLYKDLISDWEEATILSKTMREKLNASCPLLIEGELSKSSDKKSEKALITLSDGVQIETVLMRHKDNRRTVCVSSQVGCPMACGFCATGMMGFKRNMTRDEIVEQVLFWARRLKAAGEGNVTNVVFMGMGEPFLNYQNVIAAIRIMNDKDALNIGARHISISTCGLIDGIKKLAKENLQVNLAISLHASNNRLREKLMPVAKKYSLNKLLTAVDAYIEATNRKVMFEYVLIKNINDAEVNAHELVQLMHKPLYFVNLIAYNSTGKFKTADKDKIIKFKKILDSAGVEVVERFSFGGDIDAACGQLANKKKA
ncbi:MAG: 23S rRNA (adenine(2503)-C(2))-methyltransferase RlmN [Candidatus Falkowbacteria bacterium]